MHPEMNSIEAWVCQLVHQDMESEQPYVCYCTIIYEIRGRFHYLLNHSQGNGIRRPMVPGMFMLEIERYREKLLKDNN